MRHHLLYSSLYSRLLLQWQRSPNALMYRVLITMTVSHCNPRRVMVTPTMHQSVNERYQIACYAELKFGVSRVDEDISDRYIVIWIRKIAVSLADQDGPDKKHGTVKLQPEGTYILHAWQGPEV